MLGEKYGVFLVDLAFQAGMKAAEMGTRPAIRHVSHAFAGMIPIIFSRPQQIAGAFRDRGGHRRSSDPEGLPWQAREAQGGCAAGVGDQGAKKCFISLPFLVFRPSKAWGVSQVQAGWRGFVCKRQHRVYKAAAGRINQHARSFISRADLRDDRPAVSARSLSMQQIWTVLQHCGPNRLGSWLNQAATRLADCRCNLEPATEGSIAFTEAQAHQAAGEWEETLSCYDRAIELKCGTAVSLIFHCLCTAFPWLLIALPLPFRYGQPVRCHNGAAIALIGLGRFGQAIERLNKVRHCLAFPLAD